MGSQSRYDWLLINPSSDIADIQVKEVVEAGRTTRAELQRAAALIRQAGGSVGGVVIVVRGERAAEEVWE